jgi:ABC-type Fe3+/spermidine/putrescine transport system ATPase subunit
MSLLISLKNVHKNHSENKHSGVSGINLEINKGEIISIVGESGSGKTTLLKLIYGYLVPQEGEVLFNGERVLGPSEKLIPGHDAMKMVTQEVTLNLYARVFDNISSLLSNTNLEVKKNLTLQTMEFLRIDHLAYKKIVELSGGEQQRVAIARAVITEPSVLLLDEPFSQVDTILKKQLRDDIERLARFLNITVIMVSHDPTDGLSLSDKLVVIKDGKIIRQGKATDIYHNPQFGYVAQLLGKANVLKGLSFLPNMQHSFAVYPHDVYLSNAPEAIQAKVKSVHFNGFYNEVEYLIEGKAIIGYDLNFTPLSKGDEIHIAFKNLMNVD